MSKTNEPFKITETPAFSALVGGYAKEGHRKLRDDLAWLTDAWRKVRNRWAITCPA